MEKGQATEIDGAHLVAEVVRKLGEGNGEKVARDLDR